MKKTIRLVVIDDSTSFRELLNLILQGHSHLKVVGLAEDGEKGMKVIIEKRPDVILLDLEMPRMDGFTFLRWLMANYPTPTLVLSSRADSQNVFKALEFGACDFLSKLRLHEAWFKHSREFISKIETVATISQNKISQQIPLPPKPRTIIKPLPEKVSGLLAIGASTGGPRALYEIIRQLPENFCVPVVISQHMPAEFTPSFSETLNKKSFLPVIEVKGGEELENGRVYLAPGGYHLVFEKRGLTVHARLIEASEADVFVPSVDKMFSSVAELFGSKALGILLTGMGYDGKVGLEMIKAKGGTTFAESEETAVIYGMPRVAILAGVVDKVLPLYKMADEILNHYAALK